MTDLWIGSDEINFLEDAHLASFCAIPVCVFHSVNDMNCPLGSIDQLAKKLEARECNVDFEVDKEGGYGIMKPEILLSYNTWLREQGE